jgi:hypothetical protein
MGRGIANAGSLHELSCPYNCGRFYYVYACMNSGAMALDLSTTGHATDSSAANYGTEIKSGGPTRTLAGMIYTGAGTPGRVWCLHCIQAAGARHYSRLETY